MAKYIIHACKPRMDYVNDYIVPSMLKQGIAESDITVDCDSDERGCLEHTMRIFRNMPDHGDTWHLQDDILISSNFREVTERDYKGIVCGFASQYDHDPVCGETNFEHAWWSFPCIRIPNRTALKCGEYFFNVVMKSRKPHHKKFIRAKKFDDSLFKEYVRIFEPNIKVTNLNPNIVDHVDYLIGGTIVNNGRALSNVSSVFWDEPELTEALYEDIKAKCLAKCDPLVVESDTSEPVSETPKRTRRRRKN